MPTEEHFQFDQQKFKDIVHYVVDHVSNAYGSEFLGNTKLHKILYYTDMLNYLEHFKPMTGAEYQRQKFGPTARHLSAALRELTGENRVETKAVNYFGYQKTEYNSKKSPNSARISGDEKSTINHVIEFVCNQSAAEISEFSHDAVWASVPMGHRIPYYAAMAMFPAVFSEDDVNDAQAEVPELMVANS